jgi:hypothetical protein
MLPSTSLFLDPSHFGTDPDVDPDPRIHTFDLQIWLRILLFFVSDLQDANKK